MTDAPVCLAVSEWVEGTILISLGILWGTALAAFILTIRDGRGRFRVSTLFVLTTLVALAFGWIGLAKFFWDLNHPFVHH
jgi:hypothetical protein